MKTKNTYTAMSSWLFFCCFLVFCIVVVGGATRLTESGLSIVEWKPFTGILPPLNLQDWQLLFEKYQRYPEFLMVNHTMSLEQFKSIFWLEYIHRMIARFIGFAFLLPWLFFMVFRSAETKDHIKLAGIFLLGGLQGLMGWYMVKSGLVDKPDVSQYRLTAHLFLAIIIFTTMFWMALKFAAKGAKPKSFGYRPRIFNHKHKFLSFALPFMLVLVLVMVISGGFVAGTKAGHIYNTFPKMGDTWIPGSAFSLKPLWINALDNPVMIQLLHRALAIFTFAFVLITTVVTILSKKTLAEKVAVFNVFLLLCLQVILGIITLMHSVPIHLGILHQANAVIVLSLVIYANYRFKY